MPAGRKPKPSALHELEGSRNRRKNTEPQPTGAPSCPKHLDKNARTEWKRISGELSRLGLLTAVDRAALAGYCAAWSRWIHAEEQVAKFGAVIKSPKSGFPITNPYVSIANTALDKMRAFASEFGMTPASRTRINVNTPATATDPFEEFMDSLGANDPLTADDEDQLQPESTSVLP